MTVTEGAAIAGVPNFNGNDAAVGSTGVAKSLPLAERRTRGHPHLRRPADLRLAAARRNPVPL